VDRGARIQDVLNLSLGFCLPGRSTITRPTLCVRIICWFIYSRIISWYYSFDFQQSPVVCIFSAATNLLTDTHTQPHTAPSCIEFVFSLQPSVALSIFFPFCPFPSRGEFFRSVFHCAARCGVTHARGIPKSSWHLALPPVCVCSAVRPDAYSRCWT